jgi:hypothetical protein
MGVYRVVRLSVAALCTYSFKVDGMSFANVL